MKSLFERALDNVQSFAPRPFPRGEVEAVLRKYPLAWEVAAEEPLDPVEETWLSAANPEYPEHSLFVFIHFGYDGSLGGLPSLRAQECLKMLNELYAP